MVLYLDDPCDLLGFFLSDLLAKGSILSTNVPPLPDIFPGVSFPPSHALRPPSARDTHRHPRLHYAAGHDGTIRLVGTGGTGLQAYAPFHPAGLEQLWGWPHLVLRPH